MNAEDLARSAVSDSVIPDGVDDVRRCLWMARSGDWEGAHDLCQGLPGVAGSWIHAHLHRVEGDAGNAAYWYARAGKAVPAAGLSHDEEWMQIARALVG